MQVQFLANARRLTLEAHLNGSLAFDGYLIPPLYVTGTVKAELRRIVQKHSNLARVVDNGLFDDQTRISQRANLRPSATVAHLIDALTAQAVPTSARLPRTVQSWVSRVTAIVDKSAKRISAYPLKSQLALAPTGVVGIERLEPSVWFRLGIAPQWVKNGYGKLEQFNRFIADATLNPVRRATLGAVTDLPVAAATDYDSAFAAGQQFAKAGVRSAALPFGAFMADEGYASSFRVHGRFRPISGNKPARALRSALVARGFMDGWRSTSAPPPVRLHLLGLGQPMVLAIVLLALKGVRVVSCDATSPFKDAVAATLYTEVPAFRRLDGDAIVKKVIVGGGTVWDCPCPFCRSAARLQQWDQARSRIKNLSPMKLKQTLHLNRNSGLAPLLPYFSLTAPAKVQNLRALHNHWVMVRCIRRLNAAAKSDATLHSHVRRLVKSYESGAKGTSYAGVYTLAFEMGAGTWAGL